MKNEMIDGDKDASENKVNTGRPEIYNDEMARNAAKSLFDDDEGEKDSAPDKPQPPKPRSLVYDDPLPDEEDEDEDISIFKRKEKKPDESAKHAAGEVSPARREGPGGISKASGEEEMTDDDYNSFRPRGRDRNKESWAYSGDSTAPGRKDASGGAAGNPRDRLYADDSGDPPVSGRSRRPQSMYSDGDRVEPSARPPRSSEPGGPGRAGDAPRGERPYPGGGSYASSGRPSGEPHRGEGAASRAGAGRGPGPGGPRQGQDPSARPKGPRGMFSRGEGPDQNPYPQRQQKQRYGGPDPSGRGGPDKDGSYDSIEPMTLIRGIAAIAGFVFLIILVVLIVNNSLLRGRLKEAQEALDSSPQNGGDYTQLKIDYENLETDYQIAMDEIESLKRRLDNYGSSGWDGTQVSSGDADSEDDPIVRPPSGGTETPDPTPSQNRTHTVVGGDNLSKIAARYYGTSTPENIKKIADANQIADASKINVGQVLVIP